MFSLRWTRLHRFVIFGPTKNSRYHRSIPLGATDFTTGKTVCHLFCVSSNPAPLNEFCPLQASHFYHCFMLWLKDQTHSRQIPEGEREITSLSSPSWKLMSKGEKEITSEKERERSFRERERDPSGGENTSRKYFSRIPDAWCSRGEFPHVFLRGKPCSYVLICISLH